MELRTETLLNYRSTTNVTESRWPESTMRSTSVSHLDGIHRASLITFENSNSRQSVFDIHGITDLHVEEMTFPSGDGTAKCVIITVKSGDCPATVTLYGITLDKLINAVLAERVGESLVG